MYKTKEIEDLSIRLEAGEISPSVCLTLLNRINRERLELKERCEALQTLEYIEHAKKRSEVFDKSPKQSDAYFQLKDAWRNCKILTNKNVIEAIKYTQAFEDGLIDENKLDTLNIETQSMLEAMINIKSIIK